jgi:hypothetical protein
MNKHHYVYHSYEEWGRDYIGCRTCKCLPEEDTNYFGSFKDKTFKPTGKVILFVCETRKEASEIEIELHDFFDVAVNPQFANRAKATSTKFDTTGIPNKAQSERMSGKNNPCYGITGEKHPNFGVPHTEETKRRMSEALSGEKHPNFGIPQSEEHKKKISEAKKGVPQSEEHKKKVREAQIGRTRTEETKRRMSEAQLERRRREKLMKTRVANVCKAYPHEIMTLD